MNHATRRSFLARGAAFAVATLALSKPSAWPKPLLATPAPEFDTDDATLRTAYRAALACLEQNTVTLAGFPDPVLIEGSVYRGVWLECAPQEGLVYSLFNPAVGIANHRVFFDLQREDGYLPCCVQMDFRAASQIQMVVPIAATAYELFQRHGNERFLDIAYGASARWDGWLMRYRNTRATGLCEGF